MVIALDTYAPRDEVAQPTSRAARERTRALAVTEGKLVFTLASALYLTIGAVLVFHYRIVVGDALSRVANAYYMEFSRDPKLAAVGFVWTPLPSFLIAPFLPLKLLWPALTTVGFLANIESAVSMGAMVAVVAGILAEMGLRRSTRLTLVGLMAVHPMLLYYGANGMSEGTLLLALLLATRSFRRWLRDPAPSHLVATGLFLALAYLTRYEGIAAGLAVVAAVLVVSWVRNKGAKAKRRQNALADAALVGFPFVAAVASWALVSWVIVGHPFETFASRYGNSAQVAGSGHGVAGHLHALHALSYVSQQLLALAPALPVVLVVAVVVAWRRRETDVIAPIVVLGSVLAFMEVTYVKGGSFGWLRFQITGIPLVVLLAGALLMHPALARNAAGIPLSRRLFSRQWFARLPRRLFSPQWCARVLIVGAVAVSIPVTLHAFYNPVLSREEYQQFIPAIRRLTGAPHPVPGQMNIYGNEQAIARYLDGLKLPDGSVLTDDALSFPIVLASTRPRQFVITSDRDFYDAVAHPASAGIRYILVSANEGSLDVISAVYPSLYNSGARIGTVYRTFPSRQDGGRSWRIIAVTTTPRSSITTPRSSN